MPSQLSIINRALLSVGARAQISSINENSAAAQVALTLFTPTYEALGRAAHWNCFRKQVTLSLLAAAMGTPENPSGTALPLPPTPWLYQYAYPSDCLNMRFVVPSLPAGVGGVANTTYNNAAPTWLPGGGQIPFAVAYATDATGNPITVILTNQSQAQAVYTVNQPSPDIWDSQFQAAMVASLAAYFVPALALNMALMGASAQSAERIIAQARAADGNEGVTVMDRIPDWIRARGGEGGYGWGTGGFQYGGCVNMCWPA